MIRDDRPASRLSPVIEDPFGPVLGRATRRLRADADLQLEVAQELRGHLEDSAAEFREAGLTESEAAAKAAEGLGAPDVLAEQLWQTHRRRLRRRIAVRWTFGLIAAPVVIAISVSTLQSLLVAASAMSIIGAIGGGATDARWDFRVGIAPAQREWEQLAKQVPPKDRGLVEMQSILARSYDVERRVAGACAAAEASPGDTVLFCNYINQFLTLNDRGRASAPEQFATLMALLDRGSRLEPDNGYYPLLKATELMRAGAELKLDPELMPDDRSVDQQWKLKVTDVATFEHGLAALHEAAGRKYIDSHAIDMAGRLLKGLSTSRTLSDFMLRCQFRISVLLPYLNEFRTSVDFAGSYARILAEGHESQRAENIVNDEKRVALMATASSRVLVELLVGRGMTDQASFDDAAVQKALGRTELAARIAATADAAQLRVSALNRDAQDREKPRRMAEAGLLQLALGSLTVDRIDYAPGRRAEYALVDKGAVAILVLVLLLGAGGQATVLLAAGISRRRGQRPAAFFIGWQRAARVVIVGAVLPMGFYWLYATYMPIAGRGRGVGSMGSRLLVEYAAVAAVIALLLRVLTERAVGQRAKEVGVTLPPVARSRWMMVAGLLLACSVVAAAAVWQVRSGRPFDRHEGPVPFEVCFALAICLFTYAGMQLAAIRVVRHRPKNEPAAPVNGSIWRRRFPGSLIATLLAIALLCLFGLWKLPGNNGINEPLFLAICLSCTLAMLGLAIARMGLRFQCIFAKPRSVKDDPTRPLPVAPRWHLLARTTAITYAGSATVVGVLGLALLGWQERAAVAQFDRAGYTFFDELDHSRLRILRDEAVQQLQSAAPSFATFPANMTVKK